MWFPDGGPKMIYQDVLASWGEPDEEAMSWRNIKLFEPLMERYFFMKTNLFVSNLVTFSSCFDETLYMHQVVLRFTVAF